MNNMWKSFIVLSLVIIQPATASSSTANVSVGYNVPVTCVISNLPPSVLLTVMANQPTSYSTSFIISCNTSNSIALTLTSMNGQNGMARLVAANGVYLNYTASINGINYIMGQSNSVTPNANNQFTLNIPGSTNSGAFQDTLVFTITY